MKYTDILLSCNEQFKVSNKVVFFILGKPGGGKSACARDAAETTLLHFNVPRDQLSQRTLEFNASLRDPVDILGTPNNAGDFTKWVPPEEFWKFRKGTGPCVMILEELSDAPVPMQNALCSVIYDGRAGQMELSEQLFIIATGNRTEDKSGATRITTKLANRTRRVDFVENIDDWSQWALTHGIDPVLIQFLRFKPNLLSDFDPNKFCNPTPRSWERVNYVPHTLPYAVFFENVAGEVGEGAAAEYTGFRKIYENLPNIDSLLMNPGSAKVPTDPAVLFALAGALAHHVSKDNFDRVCEFVLRMPPDFQVMAVNDAIKLKPEVKTTKAFVQFAVKNANLLL